MRKAECNNLDSFKMLLEKTSSSDFDGHTDFDKLTPVERLLWLSQCAQFFSEVKRR